MNNDLISRSALQKVFEAECVGECGCCKHIRHNPEGCALVNDAPAVDAEPVRRGEWAHLGGDEWCCTSCGNVIYTEGSWEKPTKKYCHECGAKMDLKGNEDEKED